MPDVSTRTGPMVSPSSTTTVASFGRIMVAATVALRADTLAQRRSGVVAAAPLRTTLSVAPRTGFALAGDSESTALDCEGDDLLRTADGLRTATLRVGLR